MAGDEPVETVKNRRGNPAEKAADRTRESHGLQQVGHAAAVPGERAIPPREAPGIEPLAVGEPGEQRRRRVVLQRQDGEVLSPVEPDDDQGGEPAEPAPGVVEEHGAAERVYEAAPSSNPSSVARTRAPIVSST